MRDDEPAPMFQSPQPAPVLEVRGLTVDIKVPAGLLHAVNGVSFSVQPGETYCLVGESGCGKTITTLAILGLLPRSAQVAADRVAFEGRDLLASSQRDLSALRGNRIGMIFQDPM